MSFLKNIFGFGSNLVQDAAEGIAGAAGSVVQGVTGAFVEATQDATTMPTTTPAPALTTMVLPSATTVTASSTAPTVVTVTEALAKETASSATTTTPRESEEPTSTKRDASEATHSKDKHESSSESEETTSTESHSPEETAMTKSSDSETPTSTTSDGSEETSTSVTTSDTSEETRRAKEKPVDDTSSDFETSSSTADGDSQEANSKTKDGDSSDTQKASSAADKASQKADSETENETSSGTDKSASTTDNASHKPDSEAEDQTSSDTDKATSAKGDTSRQTDNNTEESISSDSDSDISTSSDESQGATSKNEDITSSNSETADSTGVDASQNSFSDSHTSGSGTDASGSGSQDSYADAVAAIDASGSEAQGGTVPIASVSQPVAHQDYSNQNYALLKPRLATSILMALSTISGFTVSPSPTFTLDASHTSTSLTISHVSSVPNDLAERWDGPTTLTTTTSPASFSDALGATTALTTYTTCAPGQGCYGRDGTFVALASIPTTPTPITTSDDVLSTPTETSAYSSTSPASSHTPLAVMYDKRGLVVRRCDDSAVPYPTPDSGSDSNPANVIGTASNSIGSMYTAGTAGSFQTAAMGADYPFPAATGDVKKRWQESRRRWAEDVDLHSRQATSTTDTASVIATSTTLAKVPSSSMLINSNSDPAPEDAMAGLASEKTKRTATEPQGHAANINEQSPQSPKSPSMSRPSSPTSKQPSKNGKGQQSPPVDAPQSPGSGSKAAGQKGRKANSPSKNQNGGKDPHPPKSGTKEFSEYLRSLPAIGPNDPDLAYAINGYRPEEIRARRAKAVGKPSGRVSKTGEKAQQSAPKGTSASKKSSTKPTSAKQNPTRKSYRKGLARRDPVNPTRNPSNDDPNSTQPGRSTRQPGSSSNNPAQANTGSAPASGNAGNTGSPNRRRFGNSLLPGRWRDRGARRAQSSPVEESATGDTARASGASQGDGPPAYDNVRDDHAPAYSDPPSYHTPDDSSGSIDLYQALQGSQRPPLVGQTPSDRRPAQSEEDLMGLQRVRMPADTSEMSTEDFEDPSGGRGTSSQGSGGGTRRPVASDSQAGRAGAGTGRHSTGGSSALPGGQGPSSRDQPGSSSQHGTTDRSDRGSWKRSLSSSDIEPHSKSQKTEVSEVERSNAERGETLTNDLSAVPDVLTRRSPGKSHSRLEESEDRPRKCRLSKKKEELKGKKTPSDKPVSEQEGECIPEQPVETQDVEHAFDMSDDLPSSSQAKPRTKQKQTKTSQSQQYEPETSDPEEPYAPRKRPPTPEYPPKNTKPGDFGLDKWSDITPEEGRRLMIKEQLAEIYPDDSIESFHPPKYPSSLAPPEPGTNPWTGDRLSQDGQDTYTPPESLSSSFSSEVSESKYVPQKQEGKSREPNAKEPKEHRLLRRTDRRPPTDLPSYEEANRGNSQPAGQGGAGRNQPPTPQAGPSNPRARPGSSQSSGSRPAASPDGPPDYTGQYHPNQRGRKDVADQRTGAPSPGSWYSGSDSYQAAPNYGVPDATSQMNRDLDEQQDFWGRHNEQYQNAERFNVRAGRSRSNSRSRAGSQTGSQSGSEDGFEGTYRAGSPGPVPPGNLHRQRPAHDTTLDSNMRFTSRHSSRPGAQMMGSPVGMLETLPAHVPERPRQRQGVARPATPGVPEEPGEGTRPSRPVTPDPNSPFRGQTGHRIDREPGSGFRGTTRGRQGSRVYSSDRTSRGGERGSGGGGSEGGGSSG